jgi:hypothetical protein
MNNASATFIKFISNRIEPIQNLAEKYSRNTYLKTFKNLRIRKVVFKKLPNYLQIIFR